MTLFYRFLLIVVVVFLSFRFLYSQSVPLKLENYIIERWTSDDGLPQNSITDIYQTDDGYIWLSTYGGLVRFDGIKFKVFSASNSPNMKYDRIEAIIPYKEKSLLLIMENRSVVIYDQSDFIYFKNIETLLNYHLSHDSITEKNIQNIAAKWSKNGFEYFKTLNANDLKLSKSRIENIDKNISENIDDTLWYMTKAKINYNFYNRKEISKEQNYVGEKENFMILDHNGNYLLGCLDYGLYYYNNKLKYFHIGGLGSLFKDIKHNYQFVVICKDFEGNFWNSKNANSLYFQNGKFISFDLSMITSGYLPKKFFVDREANLWIGTNGGGLIKLKRKRVFSLSMKDGISRKVIRSITKDKNDRIWFTTDGQIHTFFKAEIKTINNYGTGFWSIYYDSKDRLWIGSVNAGIICDSNGKRNTYTTNNGLANNDVKVIYEDRQGNIWIGTSGGLSKYRDNGFLNYTKNEGLCDNNIISLFQDKDLNLWVGTNGGGLSLLKGDKFINFSSKDGLLSEIIRSIYQDKNSNIWVGTYGGGLHKYKNGKFIPITTKNGLFSNTIHNIIEDHKDNFWMSSNDGLFCVKLSALDSCAAGKNNDLNCISFKKNDGLLNDEFNGGIQPSVCRTRENQLWYPTLDGIAVLDLERFKKNENLPSIIIETVIVDDSSYNLSTDFEIPQGKNNFEFNYTSLSFISPGKLKFRYLLEGFDKAWIDAGNRRTAFYTNIPPGKYTFKVIGCNNDGLWNEIGSSVSFKILPPIWKTWWAYVFYSLFILTSFLILLRYRIKKQEIRIEQMKIHSKKYIELQEKERKRISRELHDSINPNLIAANLKLEMIRNHQSDNPEKESFIIKEMLDNTIKEISMITHDLHPIILDNLGFIHSVINLCNKLKDRTGIDYKINSENIPKHLPQEIEINLYRIVQESLNNIEKHSKATKIVLDIYIKNGTLSINISDNGVGFDPESLQNSDLKISFGLRNIKERIDLFGGSYRINSTIGLGTEIFLKIPDYNKEKK